MSSSLLCFACHPEVVAVSLRCGSRQSQSFEDWGGKKRNYGGDLNGPFLIRPMI
jgi:hypothetical protein